MNQQAIATVVIFACAFSSLGQTLHQAVQSGDVQEVREILATTPMVMNAHDRAGFTALHLAVIKNDDEMVAVLLGAGANADVGTEREGHTPLYRAAMEGNLIISKQLIRSGARPDQADPLAVTPLMAAVRHKHVDIVRLLLESKASVSARDTSNMVPLHLAASLGNAEVASLLIQNNAEIDALDVHRQTPLNVASISGNLEVARVLVDAGANVNSVNVWGNTPLQSAVSSSKPREMFDYLLSVGAKSEPRTSLEQSLLLGAVIQGDVEALEYFSKHDDQVNVQNKYGFNLLHVAARRQNDGPNQRKIVEILIKLGVDRNAKDTKGLTPFDHAVQKGRDDISDLLRPPGQ